MPTSSVAPETSPRPIDLSVLIPALHEGPNLALLLPQLHSELRVLGVRYEILVVTQAGDRETIDEATRNGATVVVQKERGYGGALRAGFAAATGTYLLTMDADLSHPPKVISDLWAAREVGEVAIASRYVPGGSATMPKTRYALSRVLNTFFRRGLSLGVNDVSSGFRLYKTALLKGRHFDALDFDILQRILVDAYNQGWQIHEVPFAYEPRVHGQSHARVIKFGFAYVATFWSLWKVRNSILAADYDDRAHDSPIWLQRYWQRSRFKHVTELIAGQGPVLDVGCGSSRIIGALPPGSVGVDVLMRKLRYARRFGRPLVHASGFNLPMRDASFDCVLCSQVIEHVPKESPILDELCRVLKPGGRLVLGTPDYDNWQWVWMEKAYGFAAPGGYADEHIAHYTYDELVRTFEARRFTLEAARYIMKGELKLLRSCRRTDYGLSPEGGPHLVSPSGPTQH